jgi:hypothetical protein
LVASVAAARELAVVAAEVGVAVAAEAAEAAEAVEGLA